MSLIHNIYIHVQFCVAKCRYCAFFSHACASPDWDEYTNKVILEIEHWGNFLNHPDVPTVFFGGGTPSLMPVWAFDKIIKAIRKNFNLFPDAEITIEANPGTIDKEKMIGFYKSGVNRLSIGVQSFDDEKLKFLGRIHSASDARKTIDAAQNLGIRVSCDFIYGLPHETARDTEKLCNDINTIGLGHCSLYELTIEPNTPFGKMKLDMPNNETMAEMYLTIQEKLNLSRYEVSNYAVSGQECRHNQNVWDGDAYIGIGPGAAGRIYHDNTWYEQIGNGKLFNPMTNSERALERVITGLRTIRGVKIDNDVQKILDMEFAKSNPEMLRFSDDRLVATNKGILILDELITKLVK